MTDRITQIVLTLLVGVGCGLALAAPNAFATDAGPEVAVVDAGPVAAAPAVDVSPPAAPATVAPAPPTPSGVALALQNGQWLVALGGILFFLVAGAKALFKPKKRWAKYALTAGIAGAGVLGAAWWSGAGFSWALIGSAIVTMATAAWTYHAKRDVTGG